MDAGAEGGGALLEGAVDLFLVGAGFAALGGCGGGGAEGAVGAVGAVREEEGRTFEGTHRL